MKNAALEKANKVYVVCWQYSDRSAHGIIGYSRNKREAEFVTAMLKEHGETKQFYTVEVDSLEAPE